MKQNIRTLRLLAACTALSAPFLLHAQDRAASGAFLNWTNTLNITADSLVNGTRKLPAHAFMVYEADAGEAMDALKGVYAAQGAKFSGSNPVRATVTVQGVGTGPVLLLAVAEKDKKAGGARMRVTFAADDSTAVEGAGDAAHTLAVQVNRAIVQRQIDAQQKVMDKASGKLEGAQSEHAKAQKKAGNAANDLAKVKKEKSKLADKQAKLQKDHQRYQALYNAGQEAKDLEKLTKVQGQLVKVQEDLAKAMRKEADAQEKLNKRQDAVPDAQKAAQERQTTREKAMTELEALKRKLEAVR